MNVKTITKGSDQFSQGITVSIPENEEEAIKSLFLVSDRPKSTESSWSDVIQRSYSNSPRLQYRSRSAEHYQYEDVFDYVLSMIDDTEERDFVESLYDIWCERGSLSERQHTSLMKFYNSLKRRYG